MRSPQPLVLKPVAWDFGTAPAGPAMSVLGTIVARIAVVLRVIALAELAVQVILWRSFYLASPWRLWGPAVALGWGAVAISCLRRRHPGWRLLCADTAVYAVLALGAGWCVPAAMRGEPGSWLFLIVTSQIITPVWFAPRTLSAPLAVTPAVAFAAGTVLAPPASPVTANPRNTLLVLLFLVVAMHWVIRQLLCRRAAAADAGLAEADRDERDQYVILSRNIERREQDRLLHDTVLNTLTAIARSGRTETTVGQCRQDIAMLERALSDAAGVAPAGRPGECPVTAVEAAVAEMRARGLAVDLEISEGGPARPADGWDARVVAAMAHATREALSNVAAHAGTGKAWVTVRATPPDDAAAPGQLQVTVQDAGAGFDPGSVDPARLGVRRSITERVEDWGGSASVRSAPGEGTVVCLSWPAARPGFGPPSPHQARYAGTGQV